MGGEKPRRALKRHLSPAPWQAQHPPRPAPQGDGGRAALTSLSRPLRPSHTFPGSAGAPHGCSGSLLVLGAAVARPGRAAPLKQEFGQAEAQLLSRAGCWSRCPAKGLGVIHVKTRPAVMSGSKAPVLLHLQTFWR